MCHAPICHELHTSRAPKVNRRFMCVCHEYLKKSSGSAPKHQKCKVHTQNAEEETLFASQKRFSFHIFLQK